jgi:hypothetical protein
VRAAAEDADEHGPICSDVKLAAASGIAAFGDAWFMEPRTTRAIRALVVDRYS